MLLWRFNIWREAQIKDHFQIKFSWDVSNCWQKFCVQQRGKGIHLHHFLSDELSICVPVQKSFSCCQKLFEIIIPNSYLRDTKTYQKLFTHAEKKEGKTTPACNHTRASARFTASYYLTSLIHPESPALMARLTDIYALRTASQKSSSHLSGRQVLLCSRSLSICAWALDSNWRKPNPVGTGGPFGFIGSQSCGFAEVNS